MRPATHTSAAEGRAHDCAPSTVRRPAGAQGDEVADTAREAGIWKQTRSGRAFPLDRFDFTDVDLHGDVAESLARICRFGGHVEGGVYSVAQHCVVGADAAMEETGDANLAAYVLLHDAHEYIIGDITTPVQHWLALVDRRMGGGGARIGILIGAAKDMLDRAIWKAAGIAPPGPTYRAAVRDYDVRLLATEMRQLLATPPMSWGREVDEARPIRMRGRLTAWPVDRAVYEYRKRLDDLCPTARRV